MISYLKGKLIHKEPAFVIIDVNGIGYQVMISLNTFSEVKDREEIKLFTHLHVREDAHILYGFANENERSMFLNLTSVNGVGPNTAMMVLSSLSPSDLRNAILREDTATLQGIKGIGGKTAQRLILELKDKVKKDSMESSALSGGGQYNTMHKEALTALMTLGISKAAAEKSLDTVLKKSGNTLSLEELVKMALKNA
jgi:Holliday junction DNA helicase RuvA